MSRSPALSVIVCTRDRYSDLASCLEALRPDVQNADVPFEVVVIDQTPHESRRNLSSEQPHVRQIFQDETGLSVARNLGIAEARAGIIAFLDDDAVPCVGWVEAMAAAFKGPSRKWVKAAGGRVDADYRHGRKPEWMTSEFEAYLSCVDWSTEERPLKPGEWIVGANMAFRKSVFDEIGLFDASLGRKGGKHLLSNEEFAIITRIGLENILYVPSASAGHIIQPSRLHQVWFRRRVYWQAVSDLIAECVYMTPGAARQYIGEFLARSRAELRSMKAFFAECPDADLLSMQLRAIYALTVLGADGLLPEPASE